MKSKATHDAIVAANKLFMSAYNSADWPALMALYTKGAKIMAPNAKAVAGAKGMTALFKSFWDEGFTAIKLTTVETGSLGGEAYEVGKYALSGKERDQGKYIVVWKKVGRRWMLHRDMFSSDLPAPPAK